MEPGTYIVWPRKADDKESRKYRVTVEELPREARQAAARPKPFQRRAR